MITLLPFLFHEIAKIMSMQLNLTFWLPKVRFLHLSFTSYVEKSLISKVLSRPTS